MRQYRPGRVAVSPRITRRGISHGYDFVLSLEVTLHERFEV